MGAPFSPLASPEHTRVDIAMLQRFLDSLDEQALLLELDKRRGGGAARHAEPELNKGESNCPEASGEPHSARMPSGVHASSRRWGT